MSRRREMVSTGGFDYYQGVEYIHGEGAYIDTGVNGQDLRSYEIDCMATEFGYYSRNIYGATCGYRNYITFVYGEDMNALIGYGSSTSYNYFNLTTIDNVRYQFDADFGNRLLTISGGQSKTISLNKSLTNLRPNVNMHLFNLNGHNIPMKGNMYRFKLYNGIDKADGIYRLMLPVKHDGVGKMLDIVNNVLYPSAINTQFTCGDETMTIKVPKHGWGQNIPSDLLTANGGGITANA